MRRESTEEPPKPLSMASPTTSMLLRPALVSEPMVMPWPEYMWLLEMVTLAMCPLPAFMAIMSSPVETKELVMVMFCELEGSMPSVLGESGGAMTLTPQMVRLLPIPENSNLGEFLRVILYMVKLSAGRVLALELR